MRSEIVDRKKFIQLENLDQYHYTISLLQESFRVKLLDQTTLQQIQEQIILVWKDLIRRYTQDESTSVQVETAESILHSVFYCLDAYTKNIGRPEKSVELLKTKPIQEIYEKGVALVTACVAEAKILYCEIKKNKLDIPLEMYNTSIDAALPEFFQKYAIIFRAHDTMCLLDYPLVFDDMKVQGIYYILNYLKTLEIETLFCSHFPTEKINQILEQYGMIYGIDYLHTPINIFEVLINNVIISVMVGNHANQLMILKSQYEALHHWLTSVDFTKTELRVHEAFKKMISDLCIDQPNLIEYIQQYKATFIQRLSVAIENDSLHNMVVMESEEIHPANRFNFISGNTISNKQFQVITQQIRECQAVTDKIQIIQDNIFSIEDFIDLLEADCIFGDEYLALYHSLSNLELTLLAKVVLEEELRTNYFNLSTSVLSQIKPNIEWQMQYVLYLQGLNSTEKDEIIKMVTSYFQKYQETHYQILIE